MAPEKLAMAAEAGGLLVLVNQKVLRAACEAGAALARSRCAAGSRGREHRHGPGDGPRVR